jgi:hypothetical protein
MSACTMAVAGCVAYSRHLAWSRIQALRAAHEWKLVRVKHQTVVDTVKRSLGVPFEDAELEKAVNGAWPPIDE